MIIDIVRIAKGKECVYVGELNNTHLILNSHNKASNTIYIPIEKIEKIELDKNKKKHYGEIVITITDRVKPLFIYKLVNPQKLIEIYQEIMNNSVDDAISII